MAFEAGAQRGFCLGMVYFEHEMGEFVEADAAIAVFVDALERLFDFVLRNIGQFACVAPEVIAIAARVSRALYSSVVGNNPDAAANSEANLASQAAFT